MSTLNVIIPTKYNEQARAAFGNLFKTLMFDRELADLNNFSNLITFTSQGATEVVVPHGLGTTPSGRIIVDQNAPAVLYTSNYADRDYFYFKSSAAGAQFTIVPF